MALADQFPPIDDRRYDDIVAEVRARIPRYTPEWTDLNDNDPGIALTQLFAWMTDLLLYRMGRVPELNQLKFLELLGIEVAPAEPALAEITFPVVDTSPLPYVIVPERTQVAAEGAPGAAPTTFETLRSLVALRAPLAGAQVQDAGGFTVVDPNAPFEPFGPLAAADSALMLGFASADPLPEVTLELAVLAADDPAAPATAECGLPATAVVPPARLAWEAWTGSEWIGIGLIKDESSALTRSGHVLLVLPLAGVVALASLGAPSLPALRWIRARIDQAGYARPPRLEAVATNTVGAHQAETVNGEVLGGSDGRPFQRFRLANAPVLAGSLRLEVDEGSGAELWTPAPDFFASGPHDHQYALNRTTGEVAFGDGEHGAIPVGNPQNPGANVVARTYAFGGGRAGNVGAGTLRTLVTPVDGIDENGLTNRRAAHSGRNEETLEAAKQRAPRTLKSKCRAVTREDFAELAKQAAEIRRADTRPLAHPSFPGARVPGVVTVTVVPDSPDPRPIPSAGTLRTVCAYLDARRLLTTEVYVVAPTYREVEIRGRVIATPSADPAEVRAAVNGELLRYLHPLTGGEDGLGWPFGGNVNFSQVYQRVFTVPGVLRIERIVIVLEGEEAPECRDVPIADGELVYSTVHDVAVGYDVEEELG